MLHVGQEPYLHGDAGRLIMEFENYLRRLVSHYMKSIEQTQRILQSVHDALDLKTAIEVPDLILIIRTFACEV